METADTMEVTTTMEVPRPAREASDAWQCFICVGTTEGKAAKEIITLSCGHSVHAACWIPCVLPTLGEDSAQARYVEDRLGRKCGLCRCEFSEDLSGALKDRRALVRLVRKEYQESRARSDPAFQRILGLVRGAGLTASSAFAQLPDDTVLADPSRQPMELDAGDLIFALTNNAPRPLALAMRAELQQAGLSPSGGAETLASRMLENGLATKGFFFQLRKKQLLPQCEPLRSLLEAQIAPLVEAQDGRAMLAESERAAPTPRQPTPRATMDDVAPAPPAFNAADIFAALGPMAAPPPAAPLPQYPDELAQMMGMGFGRGACLQALRACDGDVDAAIAIVLNMG